MFRRGWPFALAFILVCTTSAQARPALRRPAPVLTRPVQPAAPAPAPRTTPDADDWQAAYDSRRPAPAAPRTARPFRHRIR